MATRSGRRQFNRSSRPNRGWSGLIEPTYTVIPAASRVLLSSFVPSNPGIDLTILRCVGGISVKTDNASSPEDQLGVFGMIAVSDAAAAIGITALPDPVDDIDFDGWFLYQSFAQSFHVATSVGFGIFDRWYSFDSKAKRILPGEGVTLVAVASNAHASEGFEIAVNLRIFAQARGTG